VGLDINYTRRRLNSGIALFPNEPVYVNFKLIFHLNR